MYVVVMALMKGLVTVMVTSKTVPMFAVHQLLLMNAVYVVVMALMMLVAVVLKLLPLACIISLAHLFRK